MLNDAQRKMAKDVLTGRRSFADCEEATEQRVREHIASYLLEKSAIGPTAVTAALRQGATILRDERGIPHIRASDPYDLFFAHGYAQAQDRLWQLDYLRRQAHGTLCEVFGREKLESDILSRTIGMTEISAGALAASHVESRDAFQAFADGVNFWMERLPAGLPVEFEMLDYEPDPWAPVDSVAIMRRWYWYLTGRLPVISTPEAVRAGIGDREAAYFQPDGETAYIVKPGNYDPEPRWPGLPAAAQPAVLWGPMETGGSNNWAAAPSIAAGDHALLASDPHVYYTVPADWYDVHMHGAGYDVIGMTYPGVPMVRFGRNRQFAWGITNNICLQRDLYVERLHPDDPERYLDGDQWAPVGHRNSRIDIRDEAGHVLDIRFAHGRPIVDHLVAEAALPRNLWEADRGANTALSLAWVGFEPSDEPKSLLDLGRARTVAEAREALSIFRCPTWNFRAGRQRGLDRLSMHAGRFRCEAGSIAGIATPTTRSMPGKAIFPSKVCPGSRTRSMGGLPAQTTQLRRPTFPTRSTEHGPSRIAPPAPSSCWRSENRIPCRPSRRCRTMSIPAGRLGGRRHCSMSSNAQRTPRSMRQFRSSVRGITS